MSYLPGWTRIVQIVKNSVIGESQKIGFQVCNAQRNTDGSQTLVLERWNSNFY